MPIMPCRNLWTSTSSSKRTSRSCWRIFRYVHGAPAGLCQIAGQDVRGACAGCYAGCCLPAQRTQAGGGSGTAPHLHTLRTTRTRTHTHTCVRAHTHTLIHTHLLYCHTQASKIEKKQVDSLTKQLEQMLANMHSGTGTFGGLLKASDNKNGAGKGGGAKAANTKRPP